MEPNYAEFWSAFRRLAAWHGMMKMAEFSPPVEQRVHSLWLNMLEAVAGRPNPEDIQEAIWRLMEMVGGQTDAAQVGELVALMQEHGLLAVYSLVRPEKP